MTLRFEEAKAESNFCIKEKIREINNSVWNQSISLSLSLSLSPKAPKYSPKVCILRKYN
jgi:hypothetical protein